MTSGLGGTEAVITKTTRLLTEKYAINSYIFIYGRRESADFSWLKNQNSTIYKPKVRNKKVQVLFSAFRLASLIKERNPDLILTITPIACKVTSLARRLSFKKNIPIIAWPHIKLDYKIKNHLLADGAFAISKHIKQQFENLGFDSKKIPLIYNPISKPAYVIPRPTEYTSFVYVGRVTYEGQKCVVDILSSCKNLNGKWSLHIIGDGDDKSKCIDFCNKNGLSDKVLWHGWKTNPWHYIAHEIKEVSALILTSEYEGFGLVLAEALSYGIYCVSSDCICGPSDIIKHGENGLLYPPRNTSQLTDILQSIINGSNKIPSPEILTKSVEIFYDSSYIDRFYRSLNTAIQMKKLRT